MPQKTKPSGTPTTASTSRGAGNARGNSRPFLGLIDSVLVADDGEVAFEGAIPASDAAAVWGWVVREVAPDLIDPAADPEDAAVVAALDAIMPELLTRARTAVDGARVGRDLERRIRTQLGSQSAWERLPVILLALKGRAALQKAQNFGRAANGIHDDAALATALQSMPVQDRAVASLLMQAAVGNVANPARLVTAAIRLAGGASEAAISRAGLGPLVEAVLAHAQSQIPLVSQVGTFGDIDLVCRAVDRFHRLARAVNAVEMPRQSRWATILASLVKKVSERLEPKLREIAPDVNKALRRSREGTDKVDADQILSALNGVFLLSSVRECRDSLAVNAQFDQSWSQVAVALEMHLDRLLAAVRNNPADQVSAARLEAGIKMAELRFGTEYADVMRRARDVAGRRLAG